MEDARVGVTGGMGRTTTRARPTTRRLMFAGANSPRSQGEKLGPGSAAVIP